MASRNSEGGGYNMTTHLGLDLVATQPSSRRRKSDEYRSLDEDDNTDEGRGDSSQVFDEVAEELQEGQEGNEAGGDDFWQTVYHIAACPPWPSERVCIPMPEFHVSTLPLEMLCTIFSFLTMRDWGTCVLVCKQWYNHILLISLSTNCM